MFGKDLVKTFLLCVKFVSGWLRYNERALPILAA